MNHGGGVGGGGIECSRRSRERRRDRSRERLNGTSPAFFHSHDARNDYNIDRSRGNGGGQNSNNWRSVTPVFGCPGGEGGGESGRGRGGRESGSRVTPLSYHHAPGGGGGRSTPSIPGRGSTGVGVGGRITPAYHGGGRMTTNVSGYSSSGSSSSGRHGHGGGGGSRPGSSLGMTCNGRGEREYVSWVHAPSRLFPRAEEGFMCQKWARSRSRSCGRDAGREGVGEGGRGRDTERRRYDGRAERWRKYKSRSKVRVYERRGGEGGRGRGGDWGWSRSRSRVRSVENTCWSQRGEIGGGGRGAGGQLDKRRQQQQQEYRPVDGYAAMAWDGGEGGRQEGRNGIRGKGERDGGQGSGGKHSGRKRERSEERVPPQPAAAGGGGGRSGLHLAEIEQGEKEWRKRQQQEKDREYREQQQQQQSLLQQEGQRKKRQQQQQEQEEEQEEEEEGRRDKKGSEGGSVDDDGESRDDSVGHYQGKPGDVIQGRYVVEKDVGMGTFGRVVQCLDRKRGRKVALKVVRNIKRYTESAQIEADILVDVNSRGGRGMTHCVQLFRDFVFEEHCCLVFERLGVSLYDFLKAHNYRPYPLYPHVRDFARQLLESLEFLHGMQLIHTDLKPENILLCDNAVVAKGGEVAREGGTEEGRSKKRVMEVPASTQVKVIDFGGATYDDDARKSTTINTRQYRGPEVILEVGWSYPSDLWSAGCIIAELYTGDVLFATHNNLEHLALIERCLGPFPREMLVKSPKGVADKFFYLTSTDRKDGGWGRCRWREELDASSQRHVRRMPWLEEVFERDRDSGIIELVRGLVEIDPRERLTATQALALPFFRDTTPAAME